MMRTDKVKYVFSIAALILGCFFVLTSCENTQNELDQVYKKKTGVEEAVNVESYLSQNGKVKARLTAPYMLRYQADSPYIEFPRTLHVDFYADSAVVESILDAKYAKYVENDRKVLLRDSVVVINIRNGDTLMTEELWWDQNKQEFYTDKPARVHQPDKALYMRKGLQAAQNLSWYNFYESSGPMQAPKESLPGRKENDTLRRGE